MPTQEQIKALVDAAREIEEDCGWTAYSHEEDSVGYCVACGSTFCNDTCPRQKLREALKPFQAA